MYGYVKNFKINNFDNFNLCCFSSFCMPKFVIYNYCWITDVFIKSESKMKIKKSQLKKLVENYLLELGLGPDPGDKSKTVSQHIKQTNDASRVASGAGQIAKAIVDVPKIISLIKPIKDAKEWADITDCDKYFHYLAFYTMVVEISNEIPDFKTKLINIGDAKEAIDFFGSKTAWWRVGENEAYEEWAKDMSINELGIDDGIKVLKGEMSQGDVINKAYSFLQYKPGTGGVTNWSQEAKDFSRPSYLKWFKNRRDLYGLNKVFMHPVLNVKLSPLERREAHDDIDEYLGGNSVKGITPFSFLNKLRKLGPFTY